MYIFIKVGNPKYRKKNERKVKKMNSPIDTKKDYQEYVNQKSPNSPIIKNCFNARIR